MIKQQIRFRFDAHGLGDVCHAVHAMRLYIAAGYGVQIQIEKNKAWIWQAAGIPIYDGPEELPPHRYLYPDWGRYFDLSTPDHESSKVAHFFEVDELPKLGTKEEVWQAVCDERIDVTPHITPEAHAEAEAFLAGLPHPIFVLHSRGTNWSEKKSIPNGVAFDLILKLVEESGGSVVVLDYDHRAPTVSDHPRIKNLKPDWGHIGCDRLCALLLQVDLLIGVDSGPFHVAGMLPSVKALGVFREIPPVRCCLPNPNATYLVPARDHHHWVTRGPEWQFVEYPGEDVTTADIAELAIKIITPEKARRVMEKFNLQQVPGRYTYRRVGHDERSMELLPGGKIGEGAGGCERAWKIEATPSGEVLTIFGDHGGPTCNLSQCEDGTLRGRWLAHEKMPIELVPAAAALATVKVGHPSDSLPDASPPFYFGVLTYKCFDLLELAIEAVLKSTVLPTTIYVLDNSGGEWQGHPSRRIKIIRAPYNLGCARGFNVLQNLIQPAPLIIGADDIEVGPDLLERMLAHPTPIVFADASRAYSVHMIREAAWDKIGPWDGKFYPAYHEDNDYAMRAKLAGVETGCPASSGFIDHGPSATKAAMTESERNALNGWFGQGRARYVAKWGGAPHLETFTQPFNGVSQ